MSSNSETTGLRRHEIIERRLLTRQDINPGERMVLQCLLAHRNRRTGLCCPSQVTVAREIGLRRTSVNRIIARLESKGIITTVSFGTYKSKRYYFRSLSKSQDAARREYEKRRRQAS